MVARVSGVRCASIYFVNTKALCSLRNNSRPSEYLYSVFQPQYLRQSSSLPEIDFCHPGICGAVRTYQTVCRLCCRPRLQSCVLDASHASLVVTRRSSAGCNEFGVSEVVKSIKMFLEKTQGRARKCNEGEFEGFGVCWKFEGLGETAEMGQLVER